jgi:hypothetical protein
MKANLTNKNFFMTDIKNFGHIGEINTTEKGDIINNKGGDRPVAKKPGNVWANGSFFLLACLLIGGGVYLVSQKTISVYIFLLILVGCVLLFTIVGAFVLKSSGNTDDKSFLALMKLAFSKIPVLSLFLKKKGDESKP